MSGKIGDPGASGALLAPKARRRLCWLEGRPGISPVWLLARSLSELINTIYTRGGEAGEAELWVCGDQVSEVLQATRGGRFAWSRKA